ncbi:MAG: Ig-like domain-containing protein [Myxococcota bacterium]
MIHIAAGVAVALSAAGTGAGCDSASVDVRFDIPSGYAELTTAIRVRVIVPPEPPSPDFDCDDIALQEVGAETLEAREILELSAERLGELPLSGIPRQGTKLFWLEALDAQGQTVAAGCSSAGEIIGRAEVTVFGEPAKVASFEGVSEVGINDIGDPLPDQVGLRVTDTTGAPLSGQTVQWQIIGVAGAVQGSGQATTGPNGLAIINSTLAEHQPGPSLLDARVRWERTPLPVIGRFNPLQPLLDVGELSGVADDQNTTRTANLYMVGLIGPNGERGVVALGANNGPISAGRAVTAAYYDPLAGDPPFTVVNSPGPLPGAVAVAAITRQGRQIAVVASRTALFELAISPTGITVAEEQPLLDSGSVLSLVPAGSCQEDSDELLLQRATMSGITLELFRASAPQQAESFQDEQARRLPSSGCASLLGEDLVRTVVFGAPISGEGDNAVVQSLTARSEPERSTQWLNFSSSAGFTPALDDEPAALLGVEVDIEGASIVRYQLAPQSDTGLELERLDQDQVFTTVRTMTGADVDGDGQVDIAAALDFGSRDEEGRSAFRVQMILGAEHRGKRIVGMSNEQRGRNPHLVAADFDGDGADDILFADRGKFTIFRGVAVPTPAR